MTKLHLALGLMLLVAACGADKATPTPVRTPTPAPATPTLAPATPTAGRPTPTPGPATPVARPTPTPIPTAVLPTPTPRPVTGAPTPVVVPGGKRGGVLNSSLRASYITAFDTFSADGSLSAVAGHSLLLNSLIWLDPYGDGRTLIGDAARDWAFSANGTVLTFSLHRGIVYHDGKPLTSKDVAYNLERAWKPRDPKTNQFLGKLDALQKVEAPDDFTLRLTLARPSHYLLQALSNSQFMIYPAHMPFPEFNSQWREKGIGSGPFKIKDVLPNTRIETVRNDQYWKPGLPYLDGVRYHSIDDATLTEAAYRTGKVDATSIDFSPLQESIIRGTLQKAQGFVPYEVVTSVYAFIFNRREPFTNPKVREAVDLTLDRPSILKLAFNNQGTPFASPFMPPELGGQWGISIAEMKSRPGYRPEKAQDAPRAKQLIQESGINPSGVTVRILVQIAIHQRFGLGDIIEAPIRELGFKTQIVALADADRSEALLKGNFEVSVQSLNLQSDDPTDFPGPVVKTGAGSNYGKWSNPRMDALLEEQDQALDFARRKALVQEVQDIIQQERTVLPLNWRTVNVGGNGYVKNYPPKLPFSFSQRFRWEQVWLDKG